MKVGFIGAGNMAGAIIRGMAANGFRGEDMLVYDTDGSKLNALFADCGICIATSGAEVAAGVDALVLAVKPQVFPEVLPPLSGALHLHMPLVISIAAGKTLEAIGALAGAGLPIIRVMPNINAKVGEAMSAFCGNELVTDRHRQIARRIFEAVGDVIELPEDKFSIFSALAGCSPAFTLLYVDALAQAGVRYGIPKAQALKIAAQAVLGTVRLLQESGDHPRELIDQVCSPGGTTIEGITALQREGLETAVMAAADAVMEKDRRL